MSVIAILGRQPALGLAELESLFGADKISPVGSSAVSLDIEASQISIDKLGGSLKLARLLDILPTSNWPEICATLLNRLPQHAKHVKGKLTIGFSLYDFDINANKLFRFSLEAKKALKKDGPSVRIVPNKTLSLNTAQVLHNKLTVANGWELCLIRSGNKTILAQTFAVQNIEKYAARDQARPKRGPKIGMLPPKLAQIMINLCGLPSGRILDPFCGTGVVLQEALLIGYQAYGSDIDPRMVSYSNANLEWLLSGFNLVDGKFHLELGDATKHQWQRPFDVVVSETYLGKPLRGEASDHLISKMNSEISQLHIDFLKNIAQQISPGARLCLAVPAWRHNNQFIHLSALDNLAILGYTRAKLKHASWDELIYWRKDQQTARELVLLQKN